MESLQIPVAQDLPQLWDEHCLALLGPFPGTERVIFDTPAGTPAEIKTFDLPLVKAIGEAWELRTQTALHLAFPLYCNFGYSVSEMVLMEAIQFCYAKAHYPDKMFMMIEAMSGMRNLSHSFDRHGMVALSLDKKYSANCNFFDDKGFENTITAYRLLDLHGLGWMALECSNWVFISKSSTGRTRERPDGNESLPKVAEANSVRDRAVFLLLTLFISRRKWIVEQPVSSSINQTDPWMKLLSSTGSSTVVFDHGAYEDEEHASASEGEEMPSTKTLKLMGTAPWIDEVKRSVQKGRKRQKLFTKDEKGQVTGKRDSMKQSEHYCKAFGAFIAATHRRYFIAQATSEGSSGQAQETQANPSPEYLA